jgi:integrase
MAKRISNEGSIYQRRDGRWCGQINLGWEAGRRKRKFFYADSAAEVQEQMLNARSDHSRGLPVATKRQSVATFLDYWLTTVRPRVRPRSYESFETIVRRHLKPEIGNIPLAKLAPAQIQTMLNRKTQNGLGPQTVTTIRTVLCNALNHALKGNLVARNVAALTSPPRVPHYEIRPLDAPQARALLDAASGTRLEALYVLALNLGLRRGELLGLRWQDIDLDNARLRVMQAVQRVEGRLQAAETKTERSRRTLSLPLSVVTSLRRHRTRQLQERLGAGARWWDSGLVFTSGIGTPLDPRSLQLDFRALLKVAQLPRVRFHDLRHSAASLLIAQGVPLRTIMELLGHSSIAMTANVYGHLAPELMREVADKMEAILGA